VIYKFYKAQVTGGGYLPQGHCLATLTLDENRNPTWSEVSEEFERLCVPWFESSVRMGPLDKIETLKPYSVEALEHLSKRQLPSQGFVMVTVEDSSKRKEAPPAAIDPTSNKGVRAFMPNAFGVYQPGMYSPPPSLFKTPPKSEESAEVSDSSDG
jgi:hypothetical protein